MMRPVRNGGVREKKDPALSERQLALSAAHSPSSLALCWPQRRKCVCVCSVCERSVNVRDGGGNTVQLELTLTRSLFSSKKSHHTTAQSPKGAFSCLVIIS